MFLFFGIPILILDWFKDAYKFLTLIYRDDVKEFGFQTKKDYIMSEPQFKILEDQIANELKK